MYCVIFLSGSRAKAVRHKNRQAGPIKMSRKTENAEKGHPLMRFPGLVQLGLSLDPLTRLPQGPSDAIIEISLIHKRRFSVGGRGCPGPRPSFGAPGKEFF